MPSTSNGAQLSLECRSVITACRVATTLLQSLPEVAAARAAQVAAWCEPAPDASCPAAMLLEIRRALRAAGTRIGELERGIVRMRAEAAGRAKSKRKSIGPCLPGREALELEDRCAAIATRLREVADPVRASADDREATRLDAVAVLVAATADLEVRGVEHSRLWLEARAALVRHEAA